MIQVVLFSLMALVGLTISVSGAIDKKPLITLIGVGLLTWALIQIRGLWGSEEG